MINLKAIDNKCHIYILKCFDVDITVTLENFHLESKILKSRRSGISVYVFPRLKAILVSEYKTGDDTSIQMSVKPFS